MFSQGSALILCLGQGSEVQVSEGGAVPNPCQALASMSRHSVSAKGGSTEPGCRFSWKTTLVLPDFFFSPFPYPQPSQAAEEGVIKNQVC